MDTEERWVELQALDDELLQGAVMLSEWCTHIVREADTAYVAGAYLASILTAVSGIETYLRGEHLAPGRLRLTDMIEASHLTPDLKADLHRLRRYRNRWVHVDDPNDDEALLADPEPVERELEAMARLAARALRRTIYSMQWI